MLLWTNAAILYFGVYIPPFMIRQWRCATSLHKNGEQVHATLHHSGMTVYGSSYFL